MAPMLRSPAGGYRQARTAAAASSAVLTMGMMTPRAPASRSAPIAAGSAEGARATGVAPPMMTASIIRVTAAKSPAPCWWSTHTKS